MEQTKPPLKIGTFWKSWDGKMWLLTDLVYVEGSSTYLSLVVAKEVLKEEGGSYQIGNELRYFVQNYWYEPTVWPNDTFKPRFLPINILHEGDLA